MSPTTGSINDKINLRGTYEAWQKFTIKDWQKSIQKARIGNTNDLLRSFTRNLVNQSGGDVEKLIFIFKYYGKFPDMGVGRGVKLGDVSELRTERGLIGKQKGNRRRPKKWYNKPFYANIQRLTEILTEKYGTYTGNMIVNEIEFKAT